MTQLKSQQKTFKPFTQSVVPTQLAVANECLLSLQVTEQDLATICTVDAF